MKRLFLLFSFLSVFLFSCKNIEKEANEIIQDFSNSLENINGLESISSYDLNSKIDGELLRLEENKKNALENISKKEDRELFNSMFILEEIDAFVKIRKILSEKTVKTINEINGKMWIESESKNPNSIFFISETEIGFLNLNNSFDFKVLNGSIFSDSYSLFFDLNNNNLSVSSKEGTRKKYELADDSHVIMGKWKNDNTYGGKYNGSGVIFENDGKGIEYGYDWEKVTYVLTGNKIKVSKQTKYFGIDVTIFNKRSNNKIQHELGAMFSRVKDSGPNGINYLYEGDFNNPSKKYTKVENSFTSKESTTSSTNWDELLDAYEKYVDEYIKFYKKAQNGDLEAIKQYPALLEKAEDFQDRLEDAQDDNTLTAKQIGRLQKIQSKLINAVL